MFIIKKLIIQNKIINKYLNSYLMKINKTKFSIPFSWYTTISTFFYIGKLPASGTFASIATYPIFYYILRYSSSFHSAKISFLLISIIFSTIGLFAITKFQNTTNTHDHPYIVIDEVIGQLLTLFFSLNWLLNITRLIPINIAENYLSFLLALISFRYFDIKKPFIIHSINSTYKGSFSVILDDILAAIFASLVIYIIYLLINISYG